MGSRVQIALVKQLNRQIKMTEKKENQRLHRELRHRVMKIEMIDEHFDDARDNVVISFDNYRAQIEEAIAINKTRFDLRINEQLETVIDQDYVEYADVLDVAEETAREFYADQNSHLFFQGLYPIHTEHTDTDNTQFACFSCIVITIMCTLMALLKL